MASFTVLGAAKPWTYWMAIPLLVIAVAAVIVLAVSYYRLVIVPGYAWLTHERLRRSARKGEPALPRPTRSEPVGRSFSKAA